VREDSQHRLLAFRRHAARLRPSFLFSGDFLSLLAGLGKADGNGLLATLALAAAAAFGSAVHLAFDFRSRTAGIFEARRDGYIRPISNKISRMIRTRPSPPDG